MLAVVKRRLEHHALEIGSRVSVGVVPDRDRAVGENQRHDLAAGLRGLDDFSLNLVRTAPAQARLPHPRHGVDGIVVKLHDVLRVQGQRLRGRDGSRDLVPERAVAPRVHVHRAGGRQQAAAPRAARGIVRVSAPQQQSSELRRVAELDQEARVIHAVRGERRARRGVSADERAPGKRRVVRRRARRRVPSRHRSPAAVDELVPGVAPVALRDEVEVGHAVLGFARRGDLNHAVFVIVGAPSPPAVVLQHVLARPLVGGVGAIRVTPRARVRSKVPRAVVRLARRLVLRLARLPIARARSAAPLPPASVDGVARRLVVRPAGVPPFFIQRVRLDCGVRAGGGHHLEHAGDARLAMGRVGIRMPQAEVARVARRGVGGVRTARELVRESLLQRDLESAAVTPVRRVRGAHLAFGGGPHAVVRGVRGTVRFDVPRLVRLAHLVRAPKVAPRREIGPCYLGVRGRGERQDMQEGHTTGETHVTPKLETSERVLSGFRAFDLRNLGSSGGGPDTRDRARPGEEAGAWWSCA